MRRADDSRTDEPLTVSEVGAATRDALSDLIARTTKDGPEDVAELEEQLRLGGWLELGSPVAQGSLTMRDLLAVAETWGGSLPALPFLEALTLARACPSETCLDDALATVAIPAGRGKALVPFASERTIWAHDPDHGWFALDVSPAEITAVDDFAPSLPLLLTRLEGRVDLPFDFVLAVAALMTSACVGAAQNCLDRSVEYANTRVAYGRMIGQFQAVRHLLAEMYRDVEVSRSGTIFFATGRGSWAGGFLQIAELCLRVISRSVQVHGGIGFTWDMGLHLYMRHVISCRKLLAALLGPYVENEDAS